MVELIDVELTSRWSKLLFHIAMLLLYGAGMYMSALMLINKMPDTNYQSWPFIVFAAYLSLIAIGAATNIQIYVIIIICMFLKVTQLFSLFNILFDF